MDHANIKIAWALIAVGILVALSGCGSDIFSNDDAVMNVKLVDAPIDGYKEINLNVQEVRIYREAEESDNASDESGWITLGRPNRTINLLELVGGVSETLVEGATLSAGHYTQMRLVLEQGNTVKLADDTVHDLKVPSGLQSGVKLIVNFDVKAGVTKDVFIDFDAANSIRLHRTGHSEKYILRPTVRAFDKALTGSISGVLTDAATGSLLADVEVLAETFDDFGTPSVIRSVRTGADGSYMLDLVPLDTPCYVVTQPVTGGVSYSTQVSGAITLTEEAPTASWSAAVAAAADAGDVSGAITPTAGENQSDTVHLVQAVLAGSQTRTFIVRSAGPVTTDTGETYSMARIPAGNYQVKGVRVTTADDGSKTTAESMTDPDVSVLSSAPAVADLVF